MEKGPGKARAAVAWVRGGARGRGRRPQGSRQATEICRIDRSTEQTIPENRGESTP